MSGHFLIYTQIILQRLEGTQNRCPAGFTSRGVENGQQPGGFVRQLAARSGVSAERRILVGPVVFIQISSTQRWNSWSGRLSDDKGMLATAVFGKPPVLK